MTTSLRQMDDAQLADWFQKGAAWLGENDRDPPGRWYLYHRMGLRPGAPMPARTEEERAAFDRWWRAYEAWLKGAAELDRREKGLAATVFEARDRDIGEVLSGDPETGS